MCLGDEWVEALDQSLGDHDCAEDPGIAQRDSGERGGAQPAHHPDVDHSHRHHRDLGEDDGGRQPDQRGDF